MSLSNQKQPRRGIKNLINLPKSLQIPSQFLDIILYQEKILLQHSSFLQWFCASFRTPKSNFLSSGFCKLYQELTERDQFLYYQASVKLAKELYSKKLEKKISSQHLPKYPWDLEDQSNLQPKLKKDFFLKINVFYKIFRSSNNIQTCDSTKIYLEVISAQGNYIEMKPLISDQIQYHSKKFNPTNGMLIPRKPIKQKTIVIDLKKFIFHREKNPDDENFQLFILTKFIQTEQKGENEVIFSDDGIQQIYFDIRHFYKYKSRKFIEFYLYSYREYLMGLFYQRPKQGMEIVLKTKNSSQNKRTLTSIKHLNDMNEIGSERKLIDLDPQLQNNFYKNGYLSQRHINEPIDLVDHDFRYDYLKNLILSKRYEKLWVDWTKDSSHVLNYVNTEKLSTQRGVVKRILKKIFSNIFSGKSVFSTSLPVTIFENVSLVEKICRCLGYAPLAFRQISSNLKKAESIHSRVKSIMIMIMGFSILYIQEMAKPFNSVLGQTFQGFIDGCPVYAEQISHNPPITFFFMKGKGYCIHGSLEPMASFGMNKIVGTNKGFVSVVFDDENEMSFTFPNTQMGDLIMGERTIKRTGVSYILCEKKKLFGKVEWGPKVQSQKSKEILGITERKADPSKQDYLEGKLYKLHEQIPLNQQNYIEVDNKAFERQILSLNGNWTSSLFIDKIHQFDFETQLPYDCIEHPFPLPSHSNLREDIKQKKLDQIEKSQTEKQKIQMIQRNDRRLRQQYGLSKGKS